MNMNFYYLCGILILSGNILSKDTVSLLGKSEINENNYAETFKNIETTYFKFVMPNNSMKDAVCNLSNEKKIELCNIIFHLPYYRKTFNIHLNKIPFYKATLPCIDNELFLLYVSDNNENREIFAVPQKMYPCFGRNEIVRTSFIEDDYYDTFYLSAGPKTGSVTVYSYTHKKNSSMLNVLDIIYNIDLFKLNGLFFTEKDLTAELKLMKKIHVTGSIPLVEKSYVRYQKYLENDPICDLPYEKKITLCNIIFNHDMYKKEMKIILNKSATYLLSMNCVTKPVYNNIMPITSQEKVRDKQRMYPCHCRGKTPTENNILSDLHVAMFYLSSGHKRNSFFVYMRMRGPYFTDHYSFLEFIENVDISHLKSTSITLKEIMPESEATYNRIKEIMEYSERLYHVELLNLAIESKSNDITAENQKFNHLVDTVEEEFSKVIEKARNGNRTEFEKLLSKRKKENVNSAEMITPTIKFRKTLSNRYTLENVMEQLLTQIDIFHIELKKGKPYTTDMIDLVNFLQLGPQVYLRLLEKIRSNIKYKINMSNLKEKDKSHQIIDELDQNLDVAEWLASKTEKTEKKKNVRLNSEMQKLIKNMEILARDTNLHNIESLAEEISTFGQTKKKEDREKKSKKSKKKRK